VRFAVSGAGGPATLRVKVVTQNIFGIVSTLDGGTFTTTPGWAPAPKLSTLFSSVVAPFGSKSMQLQISSESGSALIDDLYVDPYLTKLPRASRLRSWSRC
jgi:hypothetical protein